MGRIGFVLGHKTGWGVLMRMSVIQHTQRGISLMETLVAMALFGVLLTLGVSSYRSWVQNSQTRAAAESVLNGLSLARSEAASRNAPVSFTLTGNDWSVDVVPDPTYGIAAKNIQKRFGTEGTRNAVITSPQNTLTFNGIGRLSPGSLDTTFTITNPSAGNCATPTLGGVRCMNVMVTSGGQIRMCDPALSLANNPQGCQ